MPTVVRSQVPADAVAVRDVLTDAFGESGVRVAALAEDLFNGPAEIALVAERGGEVVGSVMMSRSWLDAPRQLVNVLVLSPLGVATGHQGQGVGGALVEAALQRAESMDAPLVFLEGEPDYYPRFGFAPGAMRGFSPPSDRIPTNAFQVFTLSTWGSWMTGRLVYCDMFWRHDAVGLRSAQSGVGG